MQQHRQFREQMKQQHRMRLQQLGMGFCDDNATRMQKVEAAYRHVRGLWEAEAAGLVPVISAPVEASTTDNDQQTVDKVLLNDRQFWSSTGSTTQVADEALLFELDGPASRVAFLQMAVYRAFYQHGYPVYPPMQLQIWLGPSPTALTPASPVMDVQATDALQTFALYTDAPIAKYLQVRMYGKLQKQQEDMQFYIAIRHITALGEPVPAPQLACITALLRSSALQLNPGGQLPGNLHGVLADVAEWGLGLTEAVNGAGHAAGGRLLLQAPQWQQHQQGSARDGTEQLVVRPQQELKSRRTWLQEQQQQQCRKRVKSSEQQPLPRQSSSAGVWSALSSRLSLGKGSRSSAAGVRAEDSTVATAGTGSDGGGTGTSSCQEAAAAVAGTSNSSVPRWLQATAATVNSSTSSTVQQTGRWTGQHHHRQQQLQHMLTEDSSDSETGDEDDFTDSGDEFGVPGQQHAALEEHVAAQGERFEQMLLQAIQRLEHPEQLEQVLAAWLQDDPLTGAAHSGSYTARLAADEQGASSSRAAEQQSHHAWGFKSPRPALRVCLQDGINSCSRSSSSVMAEHVLQHEQGCEIVPVGAERQGVGEADTTAEGVSRYTICSASADAGVDISCRADLNASCVLPLPGIAIDDTLQQSASQAAAAAIALGATPLEAAEIAAAAAQRCASQTAAVVIPGSRLFSLVANESRDVQQVISFYEEGIEQDLLLHSQLAVC